MNLFFIFLSRSISGIKDSKILSKGPDSSFFKKIEIAWEIQLKS